MTAKEMRAKTPAELNTELKELKDSLYKLRFQHSINQLDNPHKIVETKKDIARVLTILREKEMSANA
ncbi:MAG TPA: 50S ribosomal protein L29 [Bacillota bacterium]|nr:50S ribosomal protein L29 [Bacillota bacterium]